LHTHQASPVKHPDLTTPYLSQRRSYRPRCITLTASTNALMVYAPWRGCDCMCNYDEVSAITRMFRVCRGVRIMLDGISEEYFVYDTSICGLVGEVTCIRWLPIIGKADYATAAIVYKEMKRCIPSWLRKPRNVACSISCNSNCVYTIGSEILYFRENV
jgi:hypothetical protein